MSGTTGTKESHWTMHLRRSVNPARKVARNDISCRAITSGCCRSSILIRLIDHEVRCEGFRVFDMFIRFNQKRTRLFV